MDSEAIAFLRAIRATPGDQAPRLVFADWLDEHDCPEEAAAEREAAAAVGEADKYLRGLAEDYGLFDPYPRCIEVLVNEMYCHGHGGERLREDIDGDKGMCARIFLAWQTVSGKQIPHTSLVENYFTCGC